MSLLNHKLPNGTLFEQLRAEQMVGKLRHECKKTSQKAVANQLGISQAYLSDVLNGRREFPAVIASEFGYERIVTFVKWGNPTPGSDE